LTNGLPKSLASRCSLMALALGALLLSACATPSPETSQRKGFFDRFADRTEYGGEFESSRSRSPASRVREYPAEVKGNSNPAALSQVIPPRALKQQAQAISFQWPVERTELSSTFGPRGRDFHEGIDIRARIGAPVGAAQAGRVIYTGDGISGYGKLVVIRHALGFATVYAHISKILVRSGQEVKQGQLIALSGNTGRSSGPHLHFEVRKGVAALDPLRVLPSSYASIVAARKRTPGPRKSRLVRN